MNLKVLKFILICFAVPAVVTAQDYAFRVMVNKGKNEVKSGSGWQLIKVGASLKSADELKIAENSYLGLVHVNGKPLEVRQAGSYKVIDLAAKVSGGSSVLNKYTDFILSESSQKRSNLAATGAVHRGIDKIGVYLPSSDKALVYNDEVIFSWESDKAKGPYIVIFKSMFGDELARFEQQETKLRVNLNDKKFEYEDNIIVKVSSKTEPSKESDEYTLKKLSKADKERIKNTLNEFVREVSDLTALNKLILAGFYEENNLLIDAGTAFQEAIQIAPDVPSYQEAYNDFLVGHNIKEKK